MDIANLSKDHGSRHVTHTRDGNQDRGISPIVSDL